MNQEEVEAMIKAQLSDAQVKLNDLTGTRDHYEMIIISSEFEGKTLVQQQRLVNSALKEAFDTGALHALTFKTYTPTAWNSIQPTV